LFTPFKNSSKILEKIVYNSLVCFVNKHSILSEDQHGFWENRSTETACQNFIELIQTRPNDGEHVLGIFLDLSKAYEVMNHETLLGKVDYYGTRGITKTWLESYLSSHSQYVEITAKAEDTYNHKYTSPCRIIKHGVPQGSILGPLLFLLYTNDLPRYVQNAKVVLYADDINIVLTDEDLTRLQDRVNNTMKQLELWFSNNNMIINVNKTKAMLFHLKNNNVIDAPHIFYKNEKISYISQLTFLGINISCSLTWSTQIKVLCANLSKVCYTIKMLKDEVNLYVLRNIYFAKFQAVMRYGIILWGGVSEITNVLKVQKRALRLMTNKSKNESCRPIFKELKIFTVICLFIFETLSFFRKYNIYQVRNSNFHGYNTRRKDDFYIFQCNTPLYKKSVVNMNIRLHNSFPSELKELGDFKKFKRALKSFLLNNPICSLSEFSTYGQ
jgi:hypothetical protein